LVDGSLPDILKESVGGARCTSSTYSLNEGASIHVDIFLNLACVLNGEVCYACLPNLDELVGLEDSHST
jgi:hypothetical protein